ncbi:MAG: protein jag [Clostridiales bacterium]|nr:protein jag [Clostridiales bacterium]
MESIEVYGKTIEEAVESGIAQLGVTREEVEIEVLEEPATRGLIFKKVTQAKVKLTKKPSDAQRAVDFLEGLFDLINVHATTEIVRDDDKICINLTATNTSFLIGYRGEVLDALQSLASAVANIGREDYKRLVVDCENYREKREETLVQLAERLAAKAVRTGRKIILEPMIPFERRVIHTALVDNKDVKTESEGKEPNRYVVIVPNELTDERPIYADRDRAGYKDRRDNRKGGDRKSFDKGERRNGRDNRRSGSKFGREKSGESAMYGKPKDKHNVTSFGTFIGNSKKED